MQISPEIGPIRRDWFDYMNAVVGWVGLLLTVVAIIVAGGARKAANEAREAIWKRSASAAFQELARLCVQLDFYTNAQRFGEASALARILRPKFIEAMNNFGHELEGLSQKPINEVKKNLEALSDWLLDSKTFETNLQDAKTAAADSSAILSGIAGQLQQRER